MTLQRHYMPLGAPPLIHNTNIRTGVRRSSGVKGPSPHDVHNLAAAASKFVEEFGDKALPKRKRATEDELVQDPYLGGAAVSIRPTPGRAKPGYAHSSGESSALTHTERDGRRRALERAYPLAKQLAEILELEAIEPLATSAKHIRQAIGAELAEIGARDGR